MKFKVDVFDFYSDKVRQLESRVEVHKEISLNSPLGMAFVTFTHIASSKVESLKIGINVLILNF